jgi:hypothetical protein
LVQEFVQVFRAMFGKVNAHLLHHAKGERMHEPGRLRSGAGDAETSPRRRAQDAFGQMAATRIAGAEHKNERERRVAFHCSILLQPSSINNPQSSITGCFPSANGRPGGS